MSYRRTKAGKKKADRFGVVNDILAVMLKADHSFHKNKRTRKEAKRAAREARITQQKQARMNNILNQMHTLEITSKT